MFSGVFIAYLGVLRNVFPWMPVALVIRNKVLKPIHKEKHIRFQCNYDWFSGLYAAVFRVAASSDLLVENLQQSFGEGLPSRSRWAARCLLVGQQSGSFSTRNVHIQKMVAIKKLIAVGRKKKEPKQWPESNL